MNKIAYTLSCAAILFVAGFAIATVAPGQDPVAPPGGTEAAPDAARKRDEPAEAIKAVPRAEPALLNPARADDERAIRAVSAAMTRAIEAADPEAVAATFAEDAEIVDETGEPTAGREAIRARFARTFEENPGVTLDVEVQSLRFLGPDSAVERGIATIRPAEDDAAASSGPYTVVYVKRDGRWLQASVEDHPTPVAPDPESNEPYLRDLAWMIGDWVNEDSEAVVWTHIRWDDGQNYILQEFSVRTAEGATLAGTQRIGWDPTRKQIRSWLFDSEGGFGEATWSRDDQGRWITKASGTRRDGSTAEATRILTPLDDHRVLWEAVDRTLDGEALPDRDSFIMVRQPPAPGAEAEPASPDRAPEGEGEVAPSPGGR